MLARSASRVENMLFPNISSVTEIISAERVRRTERANRTGMPWRSVMTGAKSTPEYTQREVLNHRKVGQWKNFLNDCLKGVWQFARSHPAGRQHDAGRYWFRLGDRSVNIAFTPIPQFRLRLIVSDHVPGSS